MKYKVKEETVGLGVLTAKCTIVDTENNRVVHHTAREPLVLLWKEDAENLCEALNLGHMMRLRRAHK